MSLYRSGYRTRWRSNWRNALKVLLFGATPYVGPLDLAPNAEAAYSWTFKLRAAYTGNAFRLRRASDDAELDIGFVGHLTDTAAADAFLADTTGFFVTVYDQSGNGKDSTESVAGDQPEYAASVQNGLPGALFNGNSMDTPSLFDASWNKAISIYTAGKSNSTLQVSNGFTGNYYCVRSTTSGISFSAIGQSLTRANQFPASNMEVMLATYGGTRVRVRVDGYESIKPLTSNIGISGATVIGKLSASFPWLNHLFALIFWKRQLTEGETLGLDALSISQYGLSALFPATPLSWSAPQLVAVGDSLTYGYNAQVDYPAVLARALGWNYDNLGLVGATTATLTTNAAANDTLKNTDRSKNVLCVWIGTNNIGGGDDDATTYAAIVTYCQARQAAGWTVVVATIIARGDVAWTGTMETYRLSVNASIMTNWATFASGVIDLAADARLSNANDTTYFAADKIHLKTAGYAVVAALAQPVVGAL